MLIGNLQLRMHGLNYLGFIRQLRIDLTVEYIVEELPGKKTTTVYGSIINKIIKISVKTNEKNFNIKKKSG